ncbi:hypothetical protein ATCC90586_009858 [Pythium insidiosum]|nr:hypothetical protein ATCC90586_009858 [Pythium insidiosum]
MNVDVVRQKLLDGDADVVLAELVELYRRAEVLHTPQLARILEGLFPVWTALLQTRLPPQAAATQTHRCRKVLLQILSRLPTNDVVRPYVAQLLPLLLDVVRRDNEENALVALKTIFDLHRNFRPALRSEVPPFLDLVQQIYRNAPTTVRKQFAPPSAVPAAAAASPAPAPTAPPPPTPPTPTPTLMRAPAAADAAQITTSAVPAVAVKAESTPAPPAAVAVPASSTATAAAPAATAAAAAPPGEAIKSEAQAAEPRVVTAPPPAPPLWSALESFKTISELPLIIMLLFQCYPSYIESHIPVLVPLMMNLLGTRAPADVAALATSTTASLSASSTPSSAHGGSSPAPAPAPSSLVSRYSDFLDCQVKTLSFVTYLLRGCGSLLRPFESAICEHTVQLLTVCPKDAFVLRKDIFVAARHIISTDFRRGFYAQLELLLDDDVLVGAGRCNYHQIRPLAYSTVADMIHHVRDMLTLAQVSRIVAFYGQRIHDASLPISIQTTSIRLLLNLVDICAKNKDADGWKGRNILARILLIIATKFGAIRASLPVILAASRRPASAAGDAFLDGGTMDKMRQSPLLPRAAVEKSAHDRQLELLLQPFQHATAANLKGSVADVLTFGAGSDAEELSLRDVKSLLRTMILGVRAVIWCTANYRNPHAKDLTAMDSSDSGVSTAAARGDGAAPTATAAASTATATATTTTHTYPLTDDERQLIARVLQNGLRCFILYTLSESDSLAEEKQMLDHFAGAFTVLDAADFRDLFLANMTLLYECILQDHAILTIPQHFLANSNVSCWFAEILLKFLIAQLHELRVPAESRDLPDLPRHEKLQAMECLRLERMRAVPPAHRASIVLRLFKIVFGSVTLFKTNESALFPHLRTIIESCLREATLTKHPDNFLLLLRALFRSISGGKYEAFYKEVFPLLPGVLSALMRLQRQLQHAFMQDVLLELCLTIPARLSSLLQYLPSLMRCVVRAILSRGELAFLGLRTLEFWVDNLNPDFLYPIMTSQERLLTEIIEALNTHLLPPPYPYGELAMRILGKIGGRNRQYLLDPLHLPAAEDAAAAEPCRDLVLTLPWQGLDDSTASDGALQLEMGAVVRRAAALLQRYMRRSSHDWEHVLVKADTRLADVEDSEDSTSAGDTSGSAAGSTTAAAAAAAATGVAAAASSATGPSATKTAAGGASVAPLLLLEKDDRTVELERETIERMKLYVLQYKRDAFDVITHITAIACQLNERDSTPPGDDSKLASTMDDEDDDLAMLDSPRGVDAVGVAGTKPSATLRVLFGALFSATEDLDVGADALALLLETAERVTLATLPYCSRGDANFAALSTLQPSTLVPGNRGLSPGRHLATARRVQVLREAAYGLPELSPSQPARNLEALALALLDALAASSSALIDCAKQVLSRVVDVTVQFFRDDAEDDDDPDAAMRRATRDGGALLSLLCDVFAHACYDKTSWRVKLGAVTALRVLVDSLGASWCHENELVLVKALFFVLSDHPPEVSAVVAPDTGDALLATIRRARDVRRGRQHATDVDFASCVAFQETEVFQILVVELLSPKTPARRLAKECIAMVARLAETTESALLFPYQQLITKQITGCAVRTLPVAMRTAYIDAMAHALALQPCIFPLTKEVLLFLQDVWRLIADDSAAGAHVDSASSPGAGPSASTGVSAQEYPFGLSQSCELRIAAVRVFRAAFVAAPEEMNQHHEARNRFVGVFFRFLTRQPVELVTCAQQALTDVIQLNKTHKEITLPKELLQQCLRPVLLNLADYRKLNVPLLDGLARLLKLLSSCFNVTLGEKLLEHLKQWRDPERIIKAAIWKRGDEPAVAAAIIDLFHLLPPNETFVDAMIDCIVELEAALPAFDSYGKMSSPYRTPLTRFLNRYASTAIAFFLKRDHLLDTRYATLFQALIKMPEAAPLRAVLIGDGGAERIIESTFAQAKAVVAAAAATEPRDVSVTPTLSLATADASDDVKMQAQIQLNAQKAAAQAIATAQAQGLSPSAAEARGMQARAAYVAKAQAQVNAHQALKVQSQVQIQANAQKLHAQTLAAAQAQGLSLVQAQAKAQFASKDYIAKAQSQVAAAAVAVSSPGTSTPLPSPTAVTTTAASSALAAQQHVQAQQLHAQIQANAQKVHAQALAAAQAQGLKPLQAQEKAKQAQATYLHRAKAQAQAKMARVQQQQQGLSAVAMGALTGSLPPSPGIKTAATPTAAAAAASAGSAVSPRSQHEALELLHQGLRLVRTISKLHPAWLAAQPVLMETLRQHWRSPARVQRLALGSSTDDAGAGQRLPLRFLLETKLLAMTLVSYCRVRPDDVAVLLELVGAFAHRSPCWDLRKLLDFLQHDVARDVLSPTHKRSLVRLFLRRLHAAAPFSNSGASAANADEVQVLVLAMQRLVLPVLTATFEDPAVLNTEVLDADTVQWALREILASRETAAPSADADSAAVPSEQRRFVAQQQLLRIELLQLGTLLIQHMSKFVTDHRKDVIKFAWNHLKAPDLTSKLWAYVNVCRFIAVYDTPPKIVLQVYVALLRTFDMDARWLVRKALDVLVPALPSRLPPHEFIKAIKWTKKIAYEEGHVLPQLVHLWLLVVRHPALFYPFRGQFVPLMVNSLNRLAIPPSSTPENRRLAVQLVDLIIAWEQTRQERRQGSDTGSAMKRRSSESIESADQEMDGDRHDDKKRKVVVDTSGQTVALTVQTSGSASNSPRAAAQAPSPRTAAFMDDDFQLSPTMVELVINFAFRFALASADKQETSRLSTTCGDLFDRALQLWPSATIRFSYFDKLIAVTAEAVLRQQQQQQQQQQSKPLEANPDTSVAATTPGAVTSPGTAASTTTPSMPSFLSVPKGAPLASLAILDAVLRILNALTAPSVVAVSSGGGTPLSRSVPYVVQYAPRVMKLLEPCFDRPNPEIQRALTQFLRRMVELYPPQRAPQQLVACKFYPWLKEVLGERISKATMMQQELMTAMNAAMSTSAMASSGSTTSSGSRTKSAKPSATQPATANASATTTSTAIKAEPKAASAASEAAATSSPAKTGGASGGVKRQKSSASSGASIASALASEALKVKILAAQQLQQSHQQQLIVTRGAGQAPSLLAGEATLRLLSAMCETVPELADAFTPNLLKMAQFFAREHLVHAAAAAVTSPSPSKAASGPPSTNSAPFSSSSGNAASAFSSDSSQRTLLPSAAAMAGGATSNAFSGDGATRLNRVTATPSLAIAVEWQQLLAGKSTLSLNSVVRQLKKRKRKSPDGLSTASLATSATTERSSKKRSHSEAKDNASASSGASGGATGSSTTKTTGNSKKKNAAAGSSSSSSTATGSSHASGASAAQAHAAFSSSAIGRGLLTHKLVVELLILCLELLSKCALASAEHRRVYTTLLLHCLESSSNVPTRDTC